MPDKKTGMTITLVEGDSHGRYVGKIAAIDAAGESAFGHRGQDLISTDHTGAPDELQSTGLAAAMVDHLVADVQERGFKVIPLCPCGHARSKKHPEWHDALTVGLQRTRDITGVEVDRDCGGTPGLVRNIGIIATAIAVLASPVAAADSTARQEDTVLAAQQSTGEPTVRVPADRVAPSFRLSGEKVLFPLVVEKGIPFIEATINGVHGKLMLDTGAKRALSLNSNRIPLTSGKASGSGFFGSGQRFDIMLHDNVASVDVGGFPFRDVKNVESQDARMLEGITPDFAGWMGFEFWRGYALKLDYVKNVVTFYRDEVPAEGRLPKYLAGETVLGTIHYETRKLPNIPLVKVRIGSQSFEGAFDTGHSGYVWIDAAMRSRLISDGKLKPERQESDLMQLEGIMIEGAGTYEMSVGVLPAPFPAATPIGLPTSNVVVFGYSFLSQYKTVWDFAGKSIYLLEK